MKIFHLDVSYTALSVCKKKQVVPYAKYACLDACHLSGEFKEMLICATNQDSNGTIFILAHGLVAKENEENCLSFLRHFQNAGLANSNTFFISDKDEDVINAMRKVFPNIPHSKCLCHLSETLKKVWPTRCRYLTTNDKILQC